MEEERLQLFFFWWLICIWLRLCLYNFLKPIYLYQARFPFRLTFFLKKIISFLCALCCVFIIKLSSFVLKKPKQFLVTDNAGEKSQLHVNILVFCQYCLRRAVKLCSTLDSLHSGSVSGCSSALWSLQIQPFLITVPQICVGMSKQCL